MKVIDDISKREAELDSFYHFSLLFNATTLCSSRLNNLARCHEDYYIMKNKLTQNQMNKFEA